jgi:hypothetical protein
MTHLIVKVTAFALVADYTLRVEFDDGTVQVIDFLPVLAGELFGPLQEKALFSQVCLDPECHTLVWPNGADFDPATLHDWANFASAHENQAKGWLAAAFGSVDFHPDFDHKKLRAKR